jgi:hypothetical protein
MASGRVRLRDVVRVGEEEYGDLFVLQFADVDGAMSSVARLVPIDPPGCDFDLLRWAAVAEFDGQKIAAEYDGNAMEGIPMPPGGLARGEQQSPDQGCSAVMKRFLDHSMLQ